MTVFLYNSAAQIQKTIKFYPDWIEDQWLIRNLSHSELGFNAPYPDLGRISQKGKLC